MKPLIKFNSGYGAILCKQCRAMLKENLTKKEWDGETDLFFCPKCAEKRYLKECKDLLDFFSIDYSGDTLYLTDGGNSCIMNPKSRFYKTFGGYSINSIVEYVAKSMDKKIIWKE